MSWWDWYDDDYGRQWFGIFSWNYNLPAACRFLRHAKRSIRWYGITIPWTQVGFGVIVSRKEKEPQ